MNACCNCLWRRSPRGLARLLLGNQTAEVLLRLLQS
ncbi:hypothetical protein X754_06830 [Mesorhizobium sp. LNJC403B00]|nr:hypothetical protein X754_06830 [Mesorhizobium sp. LNJC403B00]